MSDERGPNSSALKGRLADVFVPALVEGSLTSLSRRLGNRATIDDPVNGRASTLSSIDPLLERTAKRFRDLGATYRPVASATGVDRDVSEGMLSWTADGMPVACPIMIIAERRRMREIELRIYYASFAVDRKVRAPLIVGSDDVAVPQIVAHVLDALKRGAVERVLAAFEESSRFVDPTGKAHVKKDGTMADFIGNFAGRLDLVPAGAADDGRTCVIEAVVARTRKEPEPVAFAFERGDSGLVRELRLYYEP